MRKAAIKLLKQWHDVDSAYEAGKAEGEARVLRALRKDLPKMICGVGRCWIHEPMLRHWLNSRTKPAKRKEGR